MLSLFNRLTLTQQWISATLLAMLPLVVAISYAGWSLTEQTRSQRDLINLIGRLNKMDASLHDQLTEFQRSGRQYLLIQSPNFLALFERDLHTLLSNTDRLTQILNKPPILALVKNIDSRAEAIKDTLQEQQPDKNKRDILVYLKRSKTDMTRLSELIEEHIQILLKGNDETFHSILEHLLLIGVLAIPGTVLLVVLSSVAVVRPIWRMASAIQDLGHERWGTPIEIEGPADLTSLGKSLEWMRQQLVASERQKHAFLMHITHELKTPLAAITEAGSLLYDEVPGNICPSQRQVLNILLSNAENLQALIQQLLNYNAVAHGLMRTESHVNIRSLCQRIQQKLEETRAGTHRKWRIEGTDNHIPTDQPAIDMILSNLLSNAYDFTQEDGKITVTWGVAENQWWLKVTDDGPGMSEEEAASIYRPFFQGKAKRTGPLKGSGMGLAIVHECVSQLHGDIAIKSTPGQGCEFTLRFPNHKQNAPQLEMALT